MKMAPRSDGASLQPARVSPSSFITAGVLALLMNAQSDPLASPLKTSVREGVSRAKDRSKSTRDRRGDGGVTAENSKKTKKKEVGWFQMTNRNEQKVNNRLEEEGCCTNGCENITLPGLCLSQNCQRRFKRARKKKTAPSASDLQVVDEIMNCDFCDRRFSTNKQINGSNCSQLTFVGIVLVLYERPGSHLR